MHATPSHLSRASKTTAAAFIGLTTLVAIGATNWLDLAVRLTLWREQPQVERSLKTAEPILDRYGTWLLLIGAVAATWIIRGRRVGMSAALGVGIGWVVNNALTTAIKLMTARNRARIGEPHMFEWGHVQLVDTNQWRLMAAYPSGHTGGAALAGMCAWYLSSLWSAKLRRPVRVVAIAVITAVCAMSWLRTTHWLTDIVAGVIVGWFAASVGMLVAGRRLRARGDAVDSARLTASAVS